MFKLPVVPSLFVCIAVAEISNWPSLEIFQQHFQAALLILR